MQKEKQRKNNEKVVGVITLLKVLPNSFEILFLAVNPNHHRRGTGRKLINYVEEVAKNEGAKWLFVKTLATSHPDPHYALTRKFYYLLGFSGLLESDTFWGKENPTIVLIKSI